MHLAPQGVVILEGQRLDVPGQRRQHAALLQLGLAPADVLPRQLPARLPLRLLRLNTTFLSRTVA